MMTNIPTIQELNSKTVSELHVIFRNAASISGNEQRSEEERKAARQTLSNIERSLAARHFRP